MLDARPTNYSSRYWQGPVGSLRPKPSLFSMLMKAAVLLRALRPTQRTWASGQLS